VVSLVCNSEGLAKLGVVSFQLRRLHLDLIYEYKLLFGMVNADVFPALFVVNNVDTVTLGHSHKLFVQQSRIDARKYFLSQITLVQSWNSLPATPEDFSSLAYMMLQKISATN